MSGVGATDRTSENAGGALIRRLADRGWEFPFFQAVWLLERLLGAGYIPVGGRGPTGRELVHFRPDVELGFPATDVRQIATRVDAATGRSSYRIDVTFLGLYGVSTPLPLHYAVDILRSVEPALEAKPEHTPGVEPGSAPTRDFLDVLHHRLISLFYRSWLKYRYHVTFGMPDRDVVSDYLLWLIGLSPGTTQQELGVDPIRMIRYAGLLTQRPRSATGLEGLLTDYWPDTTVQVQQCVGRWVTLKSQDLNVIGSANCRLGEDLTVGEQVYDLNGEFNLVLGPVDWATYLSLLPDGERFAQTQALVRLYGQDPLAFNVEIRLKSGQVPPARMAAQGDTVRLGYTSWVATQEVPETAVMFEATVRHGPWIAGESVKNVSAA